MNTTIQELTQIKHRLESTIRSCQTELDAINKAIELVQREQGGKSTLISTDGSRKVNEFARLGLSDACRHVVGAEFISPSEVRDSLLLGGYPIPKKGKGRLLNYVFVTLKRLSDTGGEFERGKKNGKFAVRRFPAREATKLPETANLPLN